MAYWSMQTLAAAFLGVLFLQSGLDKIFDRDGNLQWLTGHFANTPLDGLVPMMLTVITWVELGAGAVSLLGAVVLFFGGGTAVALLGAILAALALLMLFTGQRIAKDYVGAAVLVNYFILALGTIYLMG
jgi:uncharacterized membrane protein YphA (DoxX/SURF4 family)